MDIPDLVRERVGDEEITAGVSIGDEDAVCLTPTRTLVYRSEGILSDEHVEEFSHDVERLSVKEGRRKTKFAVEYVGGTETFTVPSDRGDKVLELLLQGILRREGVLDRRESIAGVYRFTELTLVITDSRVLKHIGNVVWDEDFENYPFDRVTGLDFERASNATSIAIEIDGRPQRVKVPTETARVVRQTLEEAIFGYFGVDSLEALNAAVGTSEPESVETDASGTADDIGFESGIDPLVTQGERSDETPDAPEHDTDRIDESAVPSRMDVSPGSGEDGPDHGAESGESRRGTPDPEQRGDDTWDSGTDRSGASSGSQTSTRDARDRPESGNSTGPRSVASSDAGSTSGSGGGAGSGPEKGSESRSSTHHPEREADEHTGTASPVREDQEAGTDDTDSESGPAAGSRPVEGQRRDVGDPPTDDRSGRSDGATPPPEALDYEPASSEDLAAVASQVEELTDAVERQNELLKRQHKALKELVAEIRSE